MLLLLPLLPPLLPLLLLRICAAVAAAVLWVAGQSQLTISFGSCRRYCTSAPEVCCCADHWHGATCTLLLQLLQRLLPPCNCCSPAAVLACPAALQEVHRAHQHCAADRGFPHAAIPGALRLLRWACCAGLGMPCHRALGCCACCASAPAGRWGPNRCAPSPRSLVTCSPLAYMCCSAAGHCAGVCTRRRPAGLCAVQGPPLRYAPVCRVLYVFGCACPAAAESGWVACAGAAGWLLHGQPGATDSTRSSPCCPAPAPVALPQRTRRGGSSSSWQWAWPTSTT